MLKKVAPWLQPSDMIVARQFARLEIMSTEIQARLREGGYFDADGNPLPAADFLRRLALAQARIGGELGMTTRSRIEISSGSRAVPIDVTEIAERVEKVRAARESDAEAE